MDTWNQISNSGAFTAGNNGCELMDLLKLLIKFGTVNDAEAVSEFIRAPEMPFLLLARPNEGNHAANVLTAGETSNLSHALDALTQEMEATLLHKALELYPGSKGCLKVSQRSRILPA